MQLKSTIILSVLLLLLGACTKKDTDNPPFVISINAIKDSLMLVPITFTAKVSGTPESYTWDFGDGKTATGAAPQHTYTDMGIFTVICTANVKGVNYPASYKLQVKGDSRIVGQRKFYGTHTFSTGYSALYMPINFVTVPIADTLLTFVAPSHFQLTFFGAFLTQWQHDNGVEVLYQYYFQQQVGTNLNYVKYYPANDSAYIYYSHAGFSTDPSHEYKLYQKK